MQKYFLSILFLFLAIYSYSQLIVDFVNNINDYQKYLLAPNCGVKVENFKITGNINSIGYFQNNCDELQIKKGIILSTGYVIDAVGPNNTRGCGQNVYYNGDKDLEKISKGKTFDAIILEFDFIPNSDSISFDYIFASEEYPEYVNKGVNDAFAFFISKPKSTEKINLALLPISKQAVTVDNVNLRKNKELFILNNNENKCLFQSFQFDGLTTKLNAGYKLIPYQKYHIKLCITDVRDGIYDSAVLLNANSFRSSGKYNIKNVIDTITSWPEDIEIVKVDTNSIIFAPNIEFDFNSYLIKQNSYDILNKLATFLEYHFDFQIEINGYTDSIGKNEYNDELSLRRAKSVGDYLFLKGIESYNLKVQGFGSTNYIADNSTEIGRAQNRRVTFRLIKPIIN